MAIQAYVSKQEKSQINNLTYHLKELEKERCIKCMSVPVLGGKLSNGMSEIRIEKGSQKLKTT